MFHDQSLNKKRPTLWVFVLVTFALAMTTIVLGLASSNQTQATTVNEYRANDTAVPMFEEVTVISTMMPQSLDTQPVTVQ